MVVETDFYYFKFYVRKANFFFVITSEKGKLLLVKSLGSLGFKEKHQKLFSESVVLALTECSIVKLIALQDKPVFFHVNGFMDQGVLLSLLLALAKLNIKIIGIKCSLRTPFNGTRLKKN